MGSARLARFFARRSAVMVAFLGATLLAGCHSLTSVTPNPAAPGSNITLAGTGFGPTRGPQDNVVYDGQNLAIVSWADTQIVATIPAAKPNGTYPVRVDNDAQPSATLQHTVAAPGTLVITNLTFTPNPANILSGTISFNTTLAATPAGTVTSSTAGTWTIPASGRTSPAPGASHSLTVVGMHSGVQHTFNVAATNGPQTANGGPITSTPGALPTDTPPFQLVFSNPGLMQPGYTLVTMGADEPQGGGNVYALDAQGRVVWYRQDSYLANYTQQHSNGHFFFIKGRNISDPGVPIGTLTEVDNKNSIAASWEAGDLGLDNFHHDVIELPNGNWMAISTELRTYSGYPPQSLCPGGTCNVVGDKIVEFTRAGQVVSQIKLLDILDPHRVPNYTSFNNPNWNLAYSANTRDGMRCTDIQYLPADDSVLVSCKVQSIIFKLHRPTQTMQWVIGQDDPSSTLDDTWPWLTLTNSSLYPSEQHGPELLPNGNLIVLDNGELHVPQESRSVEYSLDVPNGTMTQVWEYINPGYVPHLFNYGGGDVDAQAVGTYLISNNGLGDPPIPFGLNWSQFEEVRRSDSLKVWELKIRDPLGIKHYSAYPAKRVGSLYPP